MWIQVRRCAAWCVVVCATLTVGTTARVSTVTAADGDGVAQPGDQTGPGKCTTGPVAGGVIFSASHCTVREIDGVPVTEQGVSEPAQDPLSPLNAEHPEYAPVGLDAQWSSSASMAQTVTTPDGDVPIVGVVRPWPGMRVWKSGRVSGVTQGEVITNSVGFDGGTYVEGMQVCHGDSGSVVYTYLGPDRDAYLVGMVTNGNGGTDRISGEESPNGTCSENPPLGSDGKVLFTAIFRRIDALCDKARRVACVIQAGQLFGAFEDVVGGAGTVRVSGWAFDASMPNAVQMVEVTVAGRTTTIFVGIERSRLNEEYSLPSGTLTGFKQHVPAPPGQHDVCLRAVNIGTGHDKFLGCKPVTVT